MVGVNKSNFSDDFGGTIFIHLWGVLGYKTHPKLSKTIVTSK